MKTMNTAQTRMLIEVIMILNRELKDSDKLEVRLIEMMDALDRPPGTKKDATQPSTPGSI